MLFWLFAVLAVLALISTFSHAKTNRPTMMAYSIVIMLVWIACALYTGGYIGQA